MHLNTKLVATMRKQSRLHELLESRTISKAFNRARTDWRASGPALLVRLQATHVLEEHTGCVNTLSWNDEGSLLVSGSDDCRICVWRCVDESSTTFRSAVSTGHCRNIFAARFVPGDDEQIVTAACDGEVRLTHVATGHLRRLGLSHQFVSKVEFEPQSTSVFLATGQAGHVTRYDLREARPGKKLVDLSSVGGCTTLVFVPGSSSAFALGAEDPLVRLYDVRYLSSAPARAEPLHAFCPLSLVDNCFRRHPRSYDLYSQGASGLAYSASGDLLVNLRGADLYRFDGRGLADHAVRGIPTCTEVRAVYRGRENADTFAKEACFMHDGNLVATGGDCGSLFIWHTQSGRLALKMDGDSQIVNCVCPHPFRPLLAVSGIDNDVKMFSPAGAPAPSNHTCIPFDDVPDLASALLEARQLRLLGNFNVEDGQLLRAQAEYECALELLPAVDRGSGEADQRAAGGEGAAGGEWAASGEGATKSEIVVEAIAAAVGTTGGSGAGRERVHGERKLVGEQYADLWEERQKSELNLAAVLLRLGKHRAAAAACGRVLSSGPNVKAFYRRAQVQRPVAQRTM